MARRSFSTFKKLSIGRSDESEAADIADDFGGADAPKFKFNFTVTIKFRNGIPDTEASSPVEGDKIKLLQNMTFALKQATRPNPTINYQDVNFYNYRTKVATRMDYSTMSLTFYDDNKNRAHRVYEQYLKSVSPIANRQNANTLEGQGPKVEKFNISTDAEQKKSSASIGPLGDGNNRYGLIEKIVITHYYWNPRTEQITTSEDGEGTSVGDNIQFVNYEFLNPKISNMTLDELDMTQSEVNNIILNFNYDSVFISAPKQLVLPGADQIEVETEEETLSFETISDAANELASKISRGRRIVNRVKRLDTIPDIGLSSVNIFIPPTTGLPADIDFIKPDVDAEGIEGILRDL